MRKYLALMLAVMFMFACISPSLAAVGIKRDGVLQGTATDFDFKSMGDALTEDGSTWTFNLILAGIGNGGATSMATSTLAVPIAYGYVNKAIANDAAFTAGTLADGVPGQMLTIHIYQQFGSEVFVVTPTTAANYVSLSFNAVDDHVTLLYTDDTTGWVVLDMNSVTVNFN